MGTSKNQSSTLKKIVAGMALLGALGVGYYYSAKQFSGPIYDFDPARDTQSIVQLFKKNYYWLVEGAGYSPEFMLKYRTPKSYDPFFYGKMQIKVLREGDVFVGFCAYYMEAQKLGKISFLAIENEFRGKRYGEQLMRYALDDLKRRGAKRVWLFTRVSNESAQKLYNRVGFFETSRDEKFVYFEYAF